MAGDAPAHVTPDLHRSAGLAFAALAVGLLVIGVQLLTTCETTYDRITGAVSCPYPFQGYGLVFLYASALAIIVSVNLFGRATAGPPLDAKALEVRIVASTL